MMESAAPRRTARRRLAWAVPRTAVRRGATLSNGGFGTAWTFNPGPTILAES